MRSLLTRRTRRAFVLAARLRSETVRVCAGVGALYYLTSLVVLLGFVFGFQFVKRSANGVPADSGLLDAVAVFDGWWYTRIAADGYSYDTARRSSIAYFPVYPLLGRILSAATGMRVESALLLVSNACFFLALPLIASYMRARSVATRRGVAGTALLAVCLCPTGCFFRLAYSESVFLLVSVLLLYAMARSWPLWAVALVAGLATATRPVGVAALAPLAIDVWQRLRTPRDRARGIAVYGLLGCWGLGAFMLYQYCAFGDPIAFAKTQRHWQIAPRISWQEQFRVLATFAPLSAVYDPGSPTYWASREMHDAPWCSLQFANPLLFLLACGLIALGAWRRWLTLREVAMAALLLAIPYVTRGYEMGMASMGRFVSVALPVHISAACVAHRLPQPIHAAVFGLAAALLAIYTSLFAAGYLVF